MLTAQEIREQFTHYGLMYGVVPIYVDMTDEDCPVVATRNFIPEWALTLVDVLWGTAIFFLTLVNPDYEPTFAITLTREIVK